MDRLDWFIFEHEDPRARRRTESVRPGGMDPAEALAGKLAHAVGTELGRAPPHRQPAGLVIHYAVPIGLTLLYRTLRKRSRGVSLGGGALFGATTFLLLDEVINPMLGLAAAPSAYPWQRHVRELTGHVVYGMLAHAVLKRLDE
jgi:uncharacterized membrane protein YagU involved in acid resistance